MSRYRSVSAVPRVYEDEPWMKPLLPSLTVDGEKAVETGLIDRFGNKIVRLSDPIGFGRQHEA